MKCKSLLVLLVILLIASVSVQATHEDGKLHETPAPAPAAVPPPTPASGSSTSVANPDTFVNLVNNQPAQTGVMFAMRANDAFDGFAAALRAQREQITPNLNRVLDVSAEELITQGLSGAEHPAKTALANLDAYAKDHTGKGYKRLVKYFKEEGGLAKFRATLDKDDGKLKKKFFKNKNLARAWIEAHGFTVEGDLNIEDIGRSRGGGDYVNGVGDNDIVLSPKLASILSQRGLNPVIRSDGTVDFGGVVLTDKFTLEAEGERLVLPYGRVKIESPEKAKQFFLKPVYVRSLTVAGQEMQGGLYTSHDGKLVRENIRRNNARLGGTETFVYDSARKRYRSVVHRLPAGFSTIIELDNGKKIFVGAKKKDFTIRNYGSVDQPFFTSTPADAIQQDNSIVIGKVDEASGLQPIFIKTGKDSNIQFMQQNDLGKTPIHVYAKGDVDLVIPSYVGVVRNGWLSGSIYRKGGDFTFYQERKGNPLRAIRITDSETVYKENPWTYQGGVPAFSGQVRDRTWKGSFLLLKENKKPLSLSTLTRAAAGKIDLGFGDDLPDIVAQSIAGSKEEKPDDSKAYMVKRATDIARLLGNVRDDLQPADYQALVIGGIASSDVSQRSTFSYRLGRGGFPAILTSQVGLSLQQPISKSEFATKASESDYFVSAEGLVYSRIYGYWQYRLDDPGAYAGKKITVSNGAVTVKGDITESDRIPRVYPLRLRGTAQELATDLFAITPDAKKLDLIKAAYGLDLGAVTPASPAPSTPAPPTAPAPAPSPAPASPAPAAPSTPAPPTPASPAPPTPPAPATPTAPAPAPSPAPASPPAAPTPAFAASRADDRFDTPDEQQAAFTNWLTLTQGVEPEEVPQILSSKDRIREYQRELKKQDPSIALDGILGPHTAGASALQSLSARSFPSGFSFGATPLSESQAQAAADYSRQEEGKVVYREYLETYVSQNVDPIDAAGINSLVENRQQWAAVQAHLNTLIADGTITGTDENGNEIKTLKIDGKLGPQTQAALKEATKTMRTWLRAPEPEQAAPPTPQVPQTYTQPVSFEKQEAGFTQSEHATTTVNGKRVTVRQNGEYTQVLVEDGGVTATVFQVDGEGKKTQPNRYSGGDATLKELIAHLQQGDNAKSVVAGGDLSVTVRGSKPTDVFTYSADAQKTFKPDTFAIFGNVKPSTESVASHNVKPEDLGAGNMIRVTSNNVPEDPSESPYAEKLTKNGFHQLLVDVCTSGCTTTDIFTSLGYAAVPEGVNKQLKSAGKTQSEQVAALQKAVESDKIHLYLATNPSNPFDGGHNSQAYEYFHGNLIPVFAGKQGVRPATN